MLVPDPERAPGRRRRPYWTGGCPTWLEAADMDIAEILLERPPHPFWRMLTQIGVHHAVGVLPRYMADWRNAAGEQPWDYVPLALYREQVAEAGLQLAVIEDNPPMDALRLGTAGREEELEVVLTMLRSMGRLGIGVWCFNWMPVIGWTRTSVATPGRGGALVSGFDLEVVRDAPLTAAGAVPAERLWETLAWFLERAIPVAEEVGVTLAMHPDDPPLPALRGIARIMSSVEAFERLLELNPSPANAITLCQGNFTLMTDDLPGTIERLGERIAFVHFRDVRGTPESFVETFHDEGPTDMLACMRAYRKIGFEGVLRSDHVPVLEGDAAEVAGYSHLARLHAVGYMTGLREAALDGA
jgi:mannonate dehydratase